MPTSSLMRCTGEAYTMHAVCCSLDRKAEWLPIEALVSVQEQNPIMEDNE